MRGGPRCGTLGPGARERSGAVRIPTGSRKTRRIGAPSQEVCGNVKPLSWIGPCCVLATFAALPAPIPVACSSESEPEPAQRLRVLALGDSITEGRVSGLAAGAAGAAYVELLGSLLGKGAFETRNAGVGGATAIDWCLAGRPPLPEVDREAFELFERRAVPALPAAFVTVLLGSNDAVGFLEDAPVPVDRYAAALREIAANLHAEGAGEVVLMTPPRRPGARPEVATRLRGYRDEVLAICSDTAGVVCGPDLYRLLDPDRDFAKRNVHPNANGHRLIAEALAETLKERAAARRRDQAIGARDE